MNDNWRCPICNADARPQYLARDGFLEEVHAELIQKNQLESAQAIQIRADGTWTVKTGHDEPPHNTDKNPRPNPASAKRKADTDICLSTTTSRPKYENSPDRTSTIQANEMVVIELD